jgi:hypothetical protein
MRRAVALDAVAVLAVLAAVPLVIHRLMFVMSSEACWTVCG